MPRYGSDDLGVEASQIGDTKSVVLATSPPRCKRIIDDPGVSSSFSSQLSVATTEETTHYTSGGSGQQEEEEEEQEQQEKHQSERSEQQQHGNVCQSCSTTLQFPCHGHYAYQPSPVIASSGLGMLSDDDLAPVILRPSSPVTVREGGGIVGMDYHSEFNQILETPGGNQEKYGKNSSMLDQLVENFSKGIPVTHYDGISSTGIPTIMKIHDDHAHICVSPTKTNTDRPGFVKEDDYGYDAEDDSVSCRNRRITSLPCTAHPSARCTDMYLPIHDVIRIDVGKKLSQVLSNSSLSNVRSKLCFSVVLFDSNGSSNNSDHSSCNSNDHGSSCVSEATFDFVARTAAEREMIVSSLVLILDSVHNIGNDDFFGAVTDVYGEDIMSLPASGEFNTPGNHVDSQLKRLRMMGDDGLILSPLHRTLIHNGSSRSVPSGVGHSVRDGEGTETSLARTYSESGGTESSEEGRINPESKLSMPSLRPSIKPRFVGVVKREQQDDPYPTNDYLETIPTPLPEQAPFGVKTSKIPMKIDSCAQLANYCAVTVQDIADVCMDMFNDIDSGILDDTNFKVFCNNNDNNCCYGTSDKTYLEDSAAVAGDGGAGGASRNTVESTIAGMLGLSSNGSSSFYEGRIWSVDEWTTSASGSVVYDHEEAASKEVNEYHNKLRNRATVLNAQAKRLRRLRNEMTFFNEVKSASHRMRWIETTKSEDENDDQTTVNAPDDVVISDFRSKFAEYRAESLNEVFSGDNFSSGILSDLMGTLSFDNTPPIQDNKRANGGGDDNLYYDSDPGEVKATKKRRGPRRASIETLNEIEEKVNLSSCIPVAPLDVDAVLHVQQLKRLEPAIQESSDDSFFTNGEYTEGPLCTNPSVRQDVYLDEDFASEFLKEMINGALTLMWHRTRRGNQTENFPICVKAWIERGSRLRDTFVQPKFMWTAAYEGKLNRKRLNVSMRMPDSVQLLDVCRILETPLVDRDLHPFARTSRSFMIETCDDVFLFETESEVERNRIVYGLKLVVAQLASRLIVGDMDVYKEYFTDGIGEVPGAPPDFNEISQGEFPP